MTWLTSEACNLDEFITVVDQQADLADYPRASAIDHGAVVYESAAVREILTNAEPTAALLSELADVLLDGPGIVLFTQAFEPDVVERASTEFFALIEHERAHAIGGGDHFAEPGANDRVWNALEKLALSAPDVFADYYSNDILAAICTAWLGPAYQITSQVNVVNPGGTAQEPHRDYHLGFMTNAEAGRFPAHVHRLSPLMTLQGAVAHCDMPLESGPTMYLPHSQKYEAGYLAWRRDDFKAYFAEHHVQVPLNTGDAVFFNPALFHGAGTNSSPNIRRIANLLQVGTAMGRTLEAVDRHAMLEVLYPVLLDRVLAGADRADIDRVVAAAAEGYPFPCNLDVDQPIEGLTPPSDADRVRSALDARMSADDFAAHLGRAPTMTFAPIRTERLLLRTVRPSDAPALAERRTDPEVARLQSWETPYSLEQATSLIARAAEMDAPVSDEWWMLTIAPLDDSAILGDLALHPTWDGRAVEIGYSLAPNAWGHGYAVEAVAELVARLFEDGPVTRVHATLHPDNVASAQVLERTGFVYEGRTQLSFWVGDDNSDDLLYGMTRSQWIDWTERPRKRPSDVQLVEITPDTARSVLSLSTHKSQERFVSTMAKSFADAMFPELVDGAPVVPWMSAVETDGELVGFVMMAAVTEHHSEPYLWRLLIDRRQQRRGIGSRVVEAVLEVSRSWGAASILVSWSEGRGSPAPLYLKLGFEPTGNLLDDEIEARLTLSE